MPQFLRRAIIITFLMFFFHKCAVYLLTEVEPFLLEKYFKYRSSGIDIRFVRILSFVIWILVITYKRAWDSETVRRQWRSGWLIVEVLSLFIIMHILSSAWHMTDGLYHYTKTPSRGWRGMVYQADEVLGYKPRPNAAGVETFPIGEDLPMKFDENGFRVSPSQIGRTEMKRPLFLFLGCSWTYGAACEVEDTFPYLVALKTGGTSINAGVCAYGLAQMVLRAEELIPRYSPDYVVVQYSQWLVERSHTKYAWVYCFRVPVPYCSKTRKQEITISPPLFKTIAWRVNIDPFKGTKEGLGDFLACMFTVGAPAYFHDLYFRLIAAIKGMMGLVPAPYHNEEEIERFMYRRIYEVCKKYNCKMVYLTVVHHRTGRIKPLDLPDDVTVIDSYQPMLDYVRGDGEAYNREFLHWRTRKGKAEIVDFHPTPKAHAIIADAILQAIRNK